MNFLHLRKDLNSELVLMDFWNYPTHFLMLVNKFAANYAYLFIFQKLKND